MSYLRLKSSAERGSPPPGEPLRLRSLGAIAVMTASLSMLTGCPPDDNNPNPADMSIDSTVDVDMPADMTADADMAPPAPLALCDQEPANWPSRPLWGELTTGSPDYQNVMNNFNVLDSLKLLASMLDKAVSGINAVTDAGDDQATGHCVCNCPKMSGGLVDWSSMPSKPSEISAWATSQTIATSCYADDQTREECSTMCAPLPNFTFGGLTDKNFMWAPSDVFVNPDLSPKYALKLVNFLDEIYGFLSAGGGACTMDADCSGIGAICLANQCTSKLRQILNGLSMTGANLTMAVQDVITALEQIFALINRFTEGYHLGGYSTQRPDLHMCVGYAGHGAYAQMGNLGGDKFSIGARYTSHQLSYKHRAQFRSGGFGVQVLGKGLSLLPTPEANIQIDGFRMWDADKPFGIPMPPGGVSVGDIGKYDIFHLVDAGGVADLAGPDNIITAGELLIQNYYPATYASAADMATYTWPRSMAMPPQPWLPWQGWDQEDRSTAIFSAGLNLPLAIEPIEKTLPTIPIFPPYAYLEPYFRLGAGVEWIHEAFYLRDRLQDKINTNIPASAQLDGSAFERDMHALQAPDVSEDNGTTVYVQPELGAHLNFGLQLAKFVRLGLTASLGIGVNVKPGGWGGLVDLNYALIQALLNSNPPADAPCSPILSQKSKQVCTNAYFGEDSKQTYACSTDGVSSCCMKFGDKSICVEDWTGLEKDVCEALNTISQDPDKIQKYIDKISSFIGPQATNALTQAVAAGAQVSSTWGQGKTCAESDCKPTIALPSLDSLSSCQQHGYCADKNGTILAHDVTEAACLGLTQQGGRCCTKYSANNQSYETISCAMSEESCEQSNGVYIPGGICSSNVNRHDCTNPDDQRLGKESLIWSPYQCATETTPEVTGWEGDGCHPLNNGFPSACGCSADTDCASGESCNADGICEGTAGYACLCDPADSSSCVAGRTCIDGGCHKVCVADAECPGTMTCQSGACRPQHDIPTAESIIWAMQNGESPLHAVSTYAYSEIMALLYLNFGLKLGLQLKLFGKTFQLMLFDLQKAVDLGSTYKGWYQAGLEARYQSQCVSPEEQLVTNRMPAPLTNTYGLNIPAEGAFAGFVNRYPDPVNMLLDPNQEGNACNPGNDSNACTWEHLDAWCKEELGDNVFNPEAPKTDDLGDALSETLDWGEQIGLQVWESGQMCVNGEPWYEWSQNANGSLDGLDCIYTDPQTNATTTFPCAQADLKLLAAWGCLDTDLNPWATQLAATFGGTITTMGGQQFNPLVMMIDPNGEFAINNIKPQYLFPGGLPKGIFWMNTVEQCFGEQEELQSRCACTTNTDCPEDGQTCDPQGYCRQAESPSSFAACSPIALATPPQVEPCCGDGTLQAGEQCDDGNTTAGDGCSTYCTKEGDQPPPPDKGACCFRRQDSFVCQDVMTSQDCAKYPGGAFTPNVSCADAQCPAR